MLLLVRCLLLHLCVVCVSIVFSHCFVMQHLVSFLLNQQFHWGRENMLHYIEPVYCHVTVSVLCCFLAVLWVVMWSVIVRCPDHTHLL